MVSMRPWIGSILSTAKEIRIQLEGKKKKMKPLFGEVNEFSFQIDSWLMLQTPSEAGLPYVLPKLISQITFCEVFIQTIQIP